MEPQRFVLKSLYSEEYAHENAKKLYTSNLQEALVVAFVPTLKHHVAIPVKLVLA